MAKEKSIKYNFIMNAFLSISSVIFPLISYPYVSRILLPEGIGRVSFATSAVSYFLMVAMLGVPVYGIRACAAVRDDKEKLSRKVQEIMLINIVMGLIAYIALFISLYHVERFRTDKELFVVLSFTIALNIIGVEWLYKALEQYSYITIRSLIFKALALILMFAFVKDESDYIVYGAITVFSSAGSYILNFINLRKYIIIKPLGNYEFKPHIKLILVFFAMSVATMIYTNLDTLMLGFIKDNVQVGYYNSAVKVKGVLIGIVTSLGTVLMPRVSYYISKNMYGAFKAVTAKALNFVIILSIPLMLFFTVFADSSIYLLSGRAFEGAVLPMQIIMPTLVLIGLTNILGIQILIPMKKEKIVLYSECAGAVVDLILNFFLIPVFAASGAALGTLVAEVVVLLVQYRALKDIVKPMLKEIEFVKIIIANLVAMISVLWVSRAFSSDLVILIVGALVFFGVYGILLYLQKERLIRELTEQIVGQIKHINKKSERG